MHKYCMDKHDMSCTFNPSVSGTPIFCRRYDICLLKDEVRLVTAYRHRRTKVIRTLAALARGRALKPQSPVSMGDTTYVTLAELTLKNCLQTRFGAKKLVPCQCLEKRPCIENVAVLMRPVWDEDSWDDSHWTSTTARNGFEST